MTTKTTVEVKGGGGGLFCVALLLSICLTTDINTFSDNNQDHGGGEGGGGGDFGVVRGVCFQRIFVVVHKFSNDNTACEGSSK